MIPLWLDVMSGIALLTHAGATVHAHLEREIVNDGEDELAHRVRWKWR